MKKFVIALLLIPAAILAKDPTFLFMEKVRVVGGFYKNCVGVVKSYSESGYQSEAVYEVFVENCHDSSFYANFNESELQKVKRKK